MKLLPYLIAALIILSFYAAGLVIEALLPFTFPGSIIGMILLFFALSLKLVTITQLKPLTDIFLRYMPLFFIPAGVSVMSTFELIKGELPLIILILVTSTLIVLSVTALIAQKSIKEREHE